LITGGDGLERNLPVQGEVDSDGKSLCVMSNQLSRRAQQSEFNFI
jgi:hypothetical protein